MMWTDCYLRHKYAMLVIYASEIVGIYVCTCFETEKRNQYLIASFYPCIAYIAYIISS